MSLELERALQTLRRSPDPPLDLVRQFALLATRLAYDPAPASPRRLLGKAIELLAETPTDRSPLSIVLAAHEFELAPKSSKSPGTFWRTTGRAAEAADHWYDRATGLPLEVIRKQDRAVMALVPATELKVHRLHETFRPRLVSLETAYVDRDHVPLRSMHGRQLPAFFSGVFKAMADSGVLDDIGTTDYTRGEARWIATALGCRVLDGVRWLQITEGLRAPPLPGEPDDPSRSPGPPTPAVTSQTRRRRTHAGGLFGIAGLNTYTWTTQPPLQVEGPSDGYQLVSRRRSELTLEQRHSRYLRTIAIRSVDGLHLAQPGEDPRSAHVKLVRLARSYEDQRGLNGDNP